MKVEQKGHTAILKETKGDIHAFVENITNQYQTYGRQNLILDVSHDSKIVLNDLTVFKDLAKKHKSAKKSLVIVAQNIDFDEIPSYLIVVPSVLEAHDIIEMEEIERDLGF
jgi:chitinase